MSNKPTEQQKPTFSQILARPDVENRFQALIGERTPGFISSLLSIVRDNKLLQKAEPATILNAAATAAAIGLPIAKDLGQAWIVPYKGKAQFQIGARGFIQLALRSGQYNKINAIPIYESQFRSYNPMTEFLDCDWNAKEEGKIVGYAAYFRLIAGFEKFVYWPREKVLGHAKRYSNSFSHSNSAWKTNEVEMSIKTVLKYILRQYGILSVEMQTAIRADQSVQMEEGNYLYLDNQRKAIDVEKTEAEKEKERILNHIAGAKDLDSLNMVEHLLEKHGDAVKIPFQAAKLKIEKSKTVNQ